MILVSWLFQKQIWEKSIKWKRIRKYSKLTLNEGVKEENWGVQEERERRPKRSWRRSPERELLLEWIMKKGKIRRKLKKEMHTLSKRKGIYYGYSRLLLHRRTNRHSRLALSFNEQWLALLHRHLSLSTSQPSLSNPNPNPNWNLILFLLSLPNPENSPSTPSTSQRKIPHPRQRRRRRRRTWTRGGWRRNSRFWTLASTSAGRAVINTTRRWAILRIRFPRVSSSRSFQTIGGVPRAEPHRVSSRARAFRSQGLRRTNNTDSGEIPSPRVRRPYLYTALCCSSSLSFWVVTSSNSFSFCYVGLDIYLSTKGYIYIWMYVLYLCSHQSALHLSFLLFWMQATTRFSCFGWVIQFV